MRHTTVKAGEQIERQPMHAPSRAVAQCLAFHVHARVFRSMRHIGGGHWGGGDPRWLLDVILDQTRSDVRGER